MAWMIDGNKLKEKAVPLLFPTEMEPCGHLPSPVLAVTVSEIEDMIYRESVEMVCGQWLDGGKTLLGKQKNYICSNCKSHTGFLKFNYCCNCGAKME